MSMFEKFNEMKNEMQADVDELQRLCREGVEARVDTFIGGFEKLAAEASDEEFDAFIHNDEVSQEEAVTAVAMRVKAHIDEAVAKKENKKKEEQSKKHEPIKVIVIKKA